MPASVDMTPSNLGMIVRKNVGKLTVDRPCVIICQEWPCWLAPCLALGVPLMGVHFPPRFHAVFKSSNKGHLLHSVDAFYRTSPVQRVCTLGSGSFAFLKSILPHVHDSRQFLFIIKIPFASILVRRRASLWSKLRSQAGALGFGAVTLKHASFGGVTDAEHVLIYGSAFTALSAAFQPPAAVPRTLKQLVNSSTRGWYTPLPLPPALMSLHGVLSLLIIWYRLMACYP